MAGNFYIEPEWLTKVQGKSLYYPSAGLDIETAVQAFAGSVNSFTFCDLHYDLTEQGETYRWRLPGWLLLDEVRKGDPAATIGHADDRGCIYRIVEPASVTRRLVRDIDGRSISLRLRRGFGQYGLQEFVPDTLGVFMHRGDSEGEAGSNVWYLRNINSRHAPVGRLLDKVRTALAPRAIIVTDGSNCRAKFLRANRRQAEGADIYRQIKDRSHTHAGLRWRCVGHLNRGNAPTLVWGVERISEV